MKQLDQLEARKARHKQRAPAYRISFALVGGILVVAGIVLSLPLVPGPGVALVAVGLAMLALEFDLAERLLRRVLERVERAQVAARAWRPWQRAVALVAVVAAAVGFIGAAVLWDVPLLPV